MKNEIDFIPENAERYPAYFKRCPYSYIDVYRVFHLFGVNDPAISHAAKKLLLSGQRTGKKNAEDDIREARDALNRWLEMQQEETAACSKARK